MARRKMFNVLLIFSMLFEIYMLITIQQGVANAYNPNYEITRIEISLNLVYWLFLLAAGFCGYWYVSLPIIGLACLRDYLLVPKHWYSVYTAIADSVICIILMAIVLYKEYKKAQREW